MTVFHLPHVTSTSLGHGFGSRNRAWPCTQTMAMFLILLESHTLGQQLFQELCSQGGCSVEAQVWGLDLRYNRASAFIFLVSIK